MNRFEVRPVFRGHWKGLTNGLGSDCKPDWFARATLVLIPVGVAALSLVLGWKIAQPAPLLGGVSLLAGGLLGAFAQLSSLRLKVSEWTEHDDDKWLVERELLDETAAHVLLAALLCAVDATLLVIATSTTSASDGLPSGWTATIGAISVYVALMFIICIPRLYSAYVQINSVADHLNGHVKGRPPRRRISGDDFSQ